MQLFHAHNQWATRPADENFLSLESMYEATLNYARSAVEATVPWSSLRAQASGSELLVIGDTGAHARLTNYALGQLARKVEAPAQYLRSLAPTLAAQCLNYGLARADVAGGSDAQLLFHRNGDMLLRAATSEKYKRLWNYEVIGRLMEFCAARGLEPAHATFNWNGSDIGDVAKLQKSLYASDHDMFAFVMGTRTITDPVGQTLREGYIVINSEVGDKSFIVISFWFRDLCQNHIIWGAKQVCEVRIQHTGEIEEKSSKAFAELRRYHDTVGSFDQAAFDKMTVPIAGTKDDVLDVLFGNKAVGLSRKALEESYDAVVPEEDGDPRSPWGIVQGVTRASQKQQFAEDRFALDRAAGKILQIQF